MNGAQDRERIERRADVVRSKLMRTLEALDRKRHEALDVGLQLHRHAGGVVIAAAVAAFSLGGLTAGVVIGLARGRVPRRARLHALARAFRHPERVAQREPLLLSRLAARVVLGVTTAVLAQIAKVAVARVMNQAWRSRARSLG